MKSIATPESVRLMLNKFRRSLPPNPRKKIQVACVIYATTPGKAAMELEELAHSIREANPGFVGHGGGYYMSISYAVIKTKS